MMNADDRPELAVSERTCPNCRTAVPPRRDVIPTFCPQCGVRLPAPLAPHVPPHRPLGGKPNTPAGAIASLVLGIMGFCTPMLGFVLGLVAVFVGLDVRQRIRSSHGRLSGEGLATAGIVLGSISATFWFLACFAAAL